MKSQNRSSAILLIIVFVLPVVLAWLALHYDWFNKGVTNRGELLQPPIDMSALLSEQQPSWRMLYIVPSECDDGCENAIYSIEQIWVALGKESDRAKATLIITDNSDPTVQARMSSDKVVALLTADHQNVNQVFKDRAYDGIFLVDTMNSAMLHYPVKQQKQDAVMQSRDILADLRKLLKLSRIG